MELDQTTTDRVIQMAWEDRTTFEAIEAQFGLNEAAVIKLMRDLTAAQGTAREMSSRLDQIKLALDQTPAATPENRERVRKLITEHRVTLRHLNGDQVLAGRNENVPMSIAERVGVASEATRTIVAKPTGTHREQYAIARKQLDEQAAVIKKRLETDVKELEAILDKLGAPWTPGRLPGTGDQ